ncbi:FAS1-like dehydratase domain-containing protein [Nocardioides alcanivorans]|uniref:FAS1-like dehydratase domain-containing protein n=1 Tax=Nocardioides alcanivorans TaxID=2897352 RepID=UPI001F1E02C1|nr:MaoC family dehydratase N-terminal domain-containing protein [Nocardioides alcanivorans]
MSGPETDALHAVLNEFVGQQAEPDRVSRYAVNEAMIRNWVEAHEDENPVYVDASVAADTGRDSIICPPAMASTWVMSGLKRYREVQQLRAEGVQEDFAYSKLLAVLDEHGYTSVVATDLEQTYLQEIVPGDRIRCEFTIESVSDFKQTGLGHGCWITLLKHYRNQHDDLLIEERFKLLRFDPTRKKEAVS